MAITLMFMQLGFRGAVEDTATVIYSKMDFDLMVRSPDYLHFVAPGQIPRAVLTEIRSHTSVLSVTPFHASMANWDNPDPEEDEEKTHAVVVMGVNPVAPTFKADEKRVHRDLDKLTDPSFILIDQLSAPEYGPINDERFGPQDVAKGVTTIVSAKRVRIAGLFEMGAGLTANGALITNEEGFDRLFPFDSSNNTSMGLIKLEGNPSPLTKRQLARQLEDRFLTSEGHQRVEVLTSKQVMQEEVEHWVRQTPIGFVFTLGVIISLIVGAMIVYMVLSTDVAKRLNEYATLRAMGYTDSYLAVVVLKQAAYLAILAFGSSYLASLILYQITSVAARIPIQMTTSRVLLVLVLSVLMSVVSGLLALRKLWQAEPAELF